MIFFSSLSLSPFSLDCSLFALFVVLLFSKRLSPFSPSYPQVSSQPSSSPSAFSPSQETAMAAEGLDPVPAPGGQQATAPSNAVLAAATRVKSAATALLAQAKPWSELADRSAFSKPSDLAEVGRDWGARDKGMRRLKLRHRFLGERRRFRKKKKKKGKREQHRFSPGRTRSRPRFGVRREVESK